MPSTRKQAQGMCLMHCHSFRSGLLGVALCSSSLLGGRRTCKRTWRVEVVYGTQGRITDPALVGAAAGVCAQQTFIQRDLQVA